MPTPNRPGIALSKRGNLLLFTRTGVAVLTQFPDVRGYYRPNAGQWRGCRLFVPPQCVRLQPPRPVLSDPPSTPLVEYANPELVAERRWQGIACWKFSQKIPLPLRKATRAYADSTFELLSCFAHVPGALDLHRNCPALLYTIANGLLMLPQDPARRLDTCRRLVRWRMRAIADAAGFPGQRAVTVLRKISARQISFSRIERIRALLKDPVVLKLLAHAPQVPGVLLDCLFFGRRLFSFKFQAQLCHFTLWDQAWTLHLLRLLTRGRPGCLPCTRPCLLEAGITINREDDLLDLFARVGLSAREDAEDLRLPFPSPPIPDLPPAITAIRSGEELLAEAAEMRHCCKSYAGKIHAGTHYIYSMRNPERATISLVQNQEGCWALDDLRGVRNRPVACHTVDVVAAWLLGCPNEDFLPDDPGPQFYGRSALDAPGSFAEGNPF